VRFHRSAAASRSSASQAAGLRHTRALGCAPKLGAILPSATPVGAGEITVTNKARSGRDSIHRRSNWKKASLAMPSRLAIWGRNLEIRIQTSRILKGQAAVTSELSAELTVEGPLLAQHRPSDAYRSAIDALLRAPRVSSIHGEAIKSPSATRAHEICLTAA
jgi:hypothetical protein